MLKKTTIFASLLFFAVHAGETEEIKLNSCQQELLAHKADIQAGKTILKGLYTGKPILEKPSSTTIKKMGGYLGHLETEIPLTSPNPENIRLVMWALYGITQELNKKVFIEGTFKIEDQDNRLYNFLHACPGVYPRASSHFKEFRGPKGGGLNAEDFGLDIKNLPCHKQHLLFNQLVNKFIFIKPEDYGLGNLEDAFGHIYQYIISKIRKVSVAQQALGLTSDQDIDFSKEHPDPEMLEEFEDLLQKIEKNTETQKLHKTMAKKFGLQKIKNILEEYKPEFDKLIGEYKLSHSDTLPSELTDSWHEVTAREADESLDIAHEILNFIEKYIEPQDNPEIRKGNEVIITQAEMNKALGLGAPTQEDKELEEVD